MPKMMLVRSTSISKSSPKRSSVIMVVKPLPALYSLAEYSEQSWSSQDKQTTQIRQSHTSVCKSANVRDEIISLLCSIVSVTL